MNITVDVTYAELAAKIKPLEPSHVAVLQDGNSIAIKLETEAGMRGFVVQMGSERLARELGKMVRDLCATKQLQKGE